jgi:hypothetical protein
MAGDEMPDMVVERGFSRWAVLRREVSAISGDGTYLETQATTTVSPSFVFAPTTIVSSSAPIAYELHLVPRSYSMMPQASILISLLSSTLLSAVCFLEANPIVEALRFRVLQLSPSPTSDTLPTMMNT